MTPNETKAKVWHHAALWVQNLLNADYPQDTQDPDGPPESEAEQAAMRKEMQRVVACCYSKRQHYEKAEARCVEKARAAGLR